MVTSFYWASLSLGVDLNTFWILLPVSFFVLPAIMAAIQATLWWGGMRLLKIESLADIRFVPLFLLTWSLAEVLRSTVFLGGLPWNLLGYMWADTAFMRHSVALWGTQALTLPTLLLFMLPTLWLAKEASKRYALAVTGLSVALLAGLGVFHAFYHHPVTTHKGPWLRLVQPNLPVSRHSRGPRVLEPLVKLSQQPGFRRATHVIWPEAVLPGYLVYRALDQLKLAPGQTLITGTVRRDNGRAYNSLAALDHKGALLALYDKRNLTPFGEYVPGRALLQTVFRGDALQAITFRMNDFASGAPILPSVKLRNTPRFSPLICYDTAFEGNVVAPEGTRPTWLLEITNNAWFQNSWGLYQHLDQGRFRAIEEGMPLVRCTNSGITSVISPYGEVLQQLPIQEPGVLDTALPQARAPTPYHYGGRWPFGLTLAAMAMWLMGRTLQGDKKHRRRKRRT